MGLIEDMFGVTTSDDYRPVTWMGRYPVDVTTLIVGIHVLCAILGALLAAAGHGVLSYAMFDSALVWSGQLWRVFTYALIHPAGGTALLWFAVEMYVLFVFGREVERYLGRRKYLALYLVLLLLPAVVLAIWGLNQRTGIAGSATLHFGIFVVFAMLFPSVQFFAIISAKSVATILAAIGALSALAAHDWQSLLVLGLTIGAAFVYIRIVQSEGALRFDLQKINPFRKRPHLHVVQKSQHRRVVDPEDVYASVDPILDKIAKSGIGSLTPTERKILDRARNRLLKKDQ